MDGAIPDALVTGHEALVAGLSLPDPEDRHVLAAAIRCQAGVIVTFNLKDFSQASLQPFGIEAQHPDEFIANLFDLDRSAVLEAARRQRANLKRPAMDAKHYLQVLRRQGLVQAEQLLGRFESII